MFFFSYFKKAAPQTLLSQKGKKEKKEEQCFESM